MAYDRCADCGHVLGLHHHSGCVYHHGDPGEETADGGCCRCRGYVQPVSTSPLSGTVYRSAIELLTASHKGKEMPGTVIAVLKLPPDWMSGATPVAPLAFRDAAFKNYCASQREELTDAGQFNFDDEARRIASFEWSRQLREKVLASEQAKVHQVLVDTQDEP